MSFVLINPALVELIHDKVLYPNELKGLAKDKSLESALARVENRLAYGLIEDVFDLASAYAAAVSQGHCFNDGNKRTAFFVMDTFLDLNNINIKWDTEEIGQKIILLAQSKLSDEQLAQWLREKARTY